MKNFPRRVLAIVALLALQATANADVIEAHPGRWLGDMKIPNGPTLKIGVELYTRADGSSWASVASPTQNTLDIPVTSLTDNADTLTLTFSGNVKMKLVWVKDHFKAEFQEKGGPALTFTMGAVEQFPLKQRPQSPTQPFPYRDETPAIVSADGVTLGATLSIPNRVTRPNLVILVHGSGPQTRDQTIEGHQTFAVLADYLARQGIAVLRYDKRGIARSTGNYEQHTPQQLAEDLYAVAKTLKTRQQFKRIGFIGHSEGPGIAAAVLAKHPNAVDFVVSMAGVGLPGLEMMLLQDRATAKANGATPAEVETIVNYASKYYDIILANAQVEARMTALHAYVAKESESKAIADKYKMNQGSLALGLADKPFLRELLSADTSQDWRRVRVPVVALNGSLDQQVPVDSMRGIITSLKAAGNKKVTGIVLPNLNHLFQTATTGAEDEYAKIDETIAPIALQKIARYVLEQK